MQYDKAILAMAFAALLAAVPIMASELDADPEFTRDYGRFYSYTLQFVFDGSDAQSIEWDFGDGSDVSTEWNPRHTYAQKGTYYVTQTTTNSLGETVEVYKVQVMGFPVISFESNGGSAVAQIEMDALGETASKPADPSRDGYDFAGWFSDPALTQQYDWSSDVTRSMTLYAKWTAHTVPVDPQPTMYTVTFDTQGGSAVPAQTVESGSRATAPASPTKEGFAFKAWNLNGAAYDFSSPVTRSITLVATWTAVQPGIEMCTVSFDVLGGSTTVPSVGIEKGQLLELPTYRGTKAGYSFGGWSFGLVTYQSGDSARITGDVVFQAVWNAVNPEDVQDDEPEKKTIMGLDRNIAAIILVVILGAMVVGIAFRHSHRRF